MDERKQLSLTSRETLQTRPDVGSLRQALGDRMLLSECLDVVRAMLRNYPNGGAQAGGGYIGGLAAVLFEYPRIVATRSSDPVHGVPREVKFLPTPADVIAWCERETASLRRPVDLDDRFAGHARASKERAEEAAKLERDRVLRPTLKQMQDQYGPNWGITTGGDGVSPEVKAKQMAEIARANRIIFERECQAAGMNPNSVASPELTSIINKTRPVRTEAAE
jgi:hypothetical protein